MGKQTLEKETNNHKKKQLKKQEIFGRDIFYEYSVVHVTFLK